MSNLWLRRRTIMLTIIPSTSSHDASRIALETDLLAKNDRLAHALRARLARDRITALT